MQPSKLEQLILHVGPAKTGTTSIQHALRKVRDDLLSAGIYYPETEPPNGEGQHPLAWEILEASGTRPLRWGTARLSWQQVFDGADRAGVHTILVSSEYFSSFQDVEAFRGLRRAAGNLPITLVFGLRDPVLLVRSHWQQGVKWAVGDGEELLALDDAIPVLLQRWSIQVRPFIDLAMTHLVPVRARFFAVPRAADNRVLLDRFGQAAGFQEPLLSRLSGIDVETQNESATAEDSRLLLALNKILWSPDSTYSARADRESPVSLESRSWILEQMKREPDSENTPIRVTEAAFQTLVQLRSDILAWIAENGFEVHGSLDDLTSADEHGVRQAAGAQLRARRRRAPSTRLIELLSNTMLTQTCALRDLAADKETLSARIAELTRENARFVRRMRTRMAVARPIRRGGRR